MNYEQTTNEPSISVRLPRVLGYQLTPLIRIHLRVDFPDREAEASALGKEVYRTDLTSGISAVVNADGRLSFDFSTASPLLAPPTDLSLDFAAANQQMAWRIRILNVHLACLYTALRTQQGRPQQKMVIAPADLILSRSLDDPFPQFQDTHTAALVTALTPEVYRQVPQLHDLGIMGRGHDDIALDTIEESFRLLAQVLQHPSKHVPVYTDLLLRSCKAIEDDEYPNAVILAWAATETAIVEKWAGYVQQHSSAPQSNTMQKMVKALREMHKTGRTPNFADIRQGLLIERAITQDARDILKRVQDMRDGWLHRLATISPNDATDAMLSAQIWVNEIHDLKLRVVPHYTRTYAAA